MLCALTSFTFIVYNRRKWEEAKKKQRNHIHTPNTFTQPVIKLTFSYFQQNFLPFEHNISFFFCCFPYTINIDSDVLHAHWARYSLLAGAHSNETNHFNILIDVLDFSPITAWEPNVEPIGVHYVRKIENEHTFHSFVFFCLHWFSAVLYNNFMSTAILRIPKFIVSKIETYWTWLEQPAERKRADEKPCISLVLASIAIFDSDQTITFHFVTEHFSRWKEVLSLFSTIWHPK